MLAPHQTEAAARALELLRARRGAILADDVGLGKSFVAAEVMRVFAIGRIGPIGPIGPMGFIGPIGPIGPIRPIPEIDLIVPAALIGQWRETLARFGVRAKLLTHDALLRDTFVAEPRERLVVVDEAHAFRNPRTQRYAALARRTAGACVLLVTATPVCNGIADLEALLRLIARDDVLADEGIPSIDAAFAARDRGLVAEIVAALVIRRDRSVLPDELQFGELERRVVRHPVPQLPIDALRFPLVEECAMLRRFLWRRLESSRAAFVESLRRQQRFYERALAAIAAGRTLTKRDYRRAFAQDDDFQEVLFWDLFAPKGDADPNEIREELRKIEELLAGDAPDAKRRMLEALLTDEPTLIFTGSAATARDLHATLKGSGLVTSRERSRDAVDAVLQAFRNEKLRIVVSTDMAAEGLNLQRAAVVIHYDIPWNPVKLDQRNGRAHRIGQQRDTVRAIYFLPEGRTTKIVETVARKNRERRRALTTRQPPTANRQPTLRPRITRDAAVTRLEDPPAILLRRHKAGIERLIQENCRLSDLLALVAIECPS